MMLWTTNMTFSTHAVWSSGLITLVHLHGESVSGLMVYTVSVAFLTHPLPLASVEVLCSVNVPVKCMFSVIYHVMFLPSLTVLMYVFALARPVKHIDFFLFDYYLFYY